MINWVLAFGVICLSLALFLTWHERRVRRRRIAQQVAAVRAMFRMHDVIDADPPQETEGERNESG